MKETGIVVRVLYAPKARTALLLAPRPAQLAQLAPSTMMLPLQIHLTISYQTALRVLLEHTMP
jgi:hypothetical protein